MIIPLSIECCQKLVPEDSVRPEARTLVVLNRRKGCVGCFNFFSYISRLIKILEIFGIVWILLKNII